jgi:hypothetical protein
LKLNILIILWCALTITRLTTFAQPSWINDELVAYYPFNGDTKDYSGNELNAVNDFGIDFTSGPLGKELIVFEKPSGIDLPSPDSFKFGNNFSISFLFQLNILDQDFTFLTNEHWLRSNGYGVSFLDNRLVFSTASGGTQSDFGGKYHHSKTDEIFESNQIYHIVCTYDNVSKKIFVNGEVFAPQTFL